MRGLLSDGLDWDAVLLYARLHSVASLVHRHVERLGDPEAVPLAARRGLLAVAQATAYRNQIFARESAALTAAFEAVDVPVIEARGPRLVELIYGELGLRPIVDLMFLVRPADLEAAGAAAGGQGYSARQVRSLKAMYQWLCPQLWYVKSQRPGLYVLLKTEIIDWPRPHRFSSERLWAQAREPRGRGPWMLSATDLVLSRCLLADVHGFLNRAALATTDPTELLFAAWSNNRLIRFADIQQAVRRHSDHIDWDTLVDRARRCRIEEAVHASLRLTEDLLGRTAPADALEALTAGPRPRLRRVALAVASPPARRGWARGPMGLAWDRLGTRRQIEVFRLIGLLELAFPGPRAIRAERGPCSRPKLAWLSAKQAATTLSRSARTLVASRRRAGAAA